MKDSPLPRKNVLFLKFSIPFANNFNDGVKTVHPETVYPV